MNALNRWKIVLTLIATFAAGAATGMFLTVRATNYETQRNELRPGAPFALDGWGHTLASHAGAGPEAEADRAASRR